MQRFATAAAAIAAISVAPAVVVGAISIFPAGPATPGFEEREMHIHATLQLDNGGTPVPVPVDVGIAPELWRDHSLDAFGQMRGMSPLHTHDGTGLIHVESRVTRAYTLGEFFAIWGQSLGPHPVAYFRAEATHRLTMTVNGVPSGA